MVHPAKAPKQSQEIDQLVRTTRPKRVLRTDIWGNGDILSPLTTFLEWLDTYRRKRSQTLFRIFRTQECLQALSKYVNCQSRCRKWSSLKCTNIGAFDKIVEIRTILKTKKPFFLRKRQKIFERNKITTFLVASTSFSFFAHHFRILQVNHISTTRWVNVPKHLKPIVETTTSLARHPNFPQATQIPPSEPLTLRNFQKTRLSHKGIYSCFALHTSDSRV